MALVLPGRLLRSQSALPLRKLWTDKYAIEYIITTSDRSAFSEASQYRDILLIARKFAADDDRSQMTKIVTLRRAQRIPARHINWHKH